MCAQPPKKCSLVRTLKSIVLPSPVKLTEIPVSCSKEGIESHVKQSTVHKSGFQAALANFSTALGTHEEMPPRNCSSIIEPAAQDLLTDENSPPQGQIGLQNGGVSTKATLACTSDSLAPGQIQKSATGPVMANTQQRRYKLGLYSSSHCSCKPRDQASCLARKMISYQVGSCIITNADRTSFKNGYGSEHGQKF